MQYKEADIEIKWNKLTLSLKDQVGKKPDVQSVLFLIGVNELGKGPITFTKEEKQDLIHIANCKVLSISNFYSLEGLDEEGWPHWKKEISVPNMSPSEQDLFIKWHILQYFEEV